MMRTLALLPILLFSAVAFAAQDSVQLTEVAPHVLLFSTSNGNVITSIGPDGALLVGTPSASSTPEISRILAGRTSSTVRYVVIAPEDLAHSEGDAGWGRLGAFVLMQEKALERLGGHVMGPPHPLPSRLAELGVSRPLVSFSEVVSFDVNGEAVHVVHQPPGYSDADSIAHFHVANLVYLGEVFPGDGYPLIDPAQGADLNGLLKALDVWSGGRFRIVPARGPIAVGADLKAFHDMIATVRDRVQQQITAGRTEDQIVAAHPSAEFDTRWGHGRVTSDAFVHELYIALKH